MIVTGARQPFFYSECGVEDTPEGRYEMIALHLFLVIERLKGAGPQADRVAQRVMEAFVTDMDDSMREMGVGDLSVGKKVKRSAAGLYERFRAYRKALAERGDALSMAIGEFVPGITDARTVAAYVESRARALTRTEAEAVLNGQVAFAQSLDGEAA